MSLGVSILLGAWLLFALGYRAYALAQARAFQRRVDGFRASSGAAVVGGPDASHRPVGQDWVLLRPLHGAPAFLEPCLESLFRAAGRSGSRIALGVADPSDPAGKEAERVRERWLDVPASLRVGPGPRGCNRKVANLVQLAEGQGGDVWVLSDADIRVPSDYVERLASSLADPNVGLVTCPYRSRPGPGLGSRLDALATNTHFFPSTCAAVRLEGVRFALGSTIAVRARALHQAGGLEALLDEPGDDLELGRHVAGAGHALAWGPAVVEHWLDASGGIGAAWSRQLRWSRVTRASRPGGFAGLLAVSHGWVAALALGTALAAQGAGPAWPALLPALWWLSMAGLVAASRRALSVGWRDVVLLPLVDVFALTVGLVAFTGRPTPP